MGAASGGWGDSGVAGLRACQQARGKGQAHMTVLRAGAGLPGNAALHPANQTRTRIKLNSTKPLQLQPNCNLNCYTPIAQPPPQAGCPRRRLTAW